MTGTEKELLGGKMRSLKAIAHTKEAGWKEGDI